jgi:hypothetical protein
MTATAIYLTADTDIDFDGDEMDVFHVYAGDDDAEAVGKVYTFTTGHARAFALASKMATERGLELVTN